MKHCYFLVFIATLYICDTISAQERCWTLEECINYAYAHNIEIKQQELSAESKRLSLADSKWNYAPNISASIGYSLSMGRVLDETTYDFIENKTLSGSNTSLGTSIMLFNGLKNHYTLQRAKLDLRSSLLAIRKLRNDIRINVTAYYLEILYAEEMIRNAEQIVSDLWVQEEKIAKKIELQKVTIADLLQIQSQRADAENDVLTAKNSYDIARLNLCQLLNIDNYMGFRVSSPDSTAYITFSERIDMSVSALETVRDLPELEIARMEIAIAQKDLQITRSAYYPTLSLSAGYGSSYSDARHKLFQNADGTYRYEAYSYFDQFRDNASSYISLSLNIPLFNKFTTRRNVQRQKLVLQQTKYAMQVTEKQVVKEITEAAIEANTAWEKYLGAQKHVASAEEAARQVERKYDLGVATVTDYNAAVSAVRKARSQLIVAKYEYLFKRKIVQYYTQ